MIRSAELVRRLTGRLGSSHVHRHLHSIDGLENIPPTGPFVLVANHSSYYDHFVIGAIMLAVRDTPTWFLTKEQSFQNLLSRIWHEAWYSIPVNRERAGSATLRQVRSALSQGHAVTVYPEGTRGDGPGLLPFKDGAFRFAIDSEVPVIPMGIHGAGLVLPRGARRTFPAKVDVSFGPPLPTSSVGPRPARAAAMSTLARVSIEELLASSGARAAQATGTVAAAVVPVLDRLITSNLSDDGRLSPDLQRRARLLTKFVAAMDATNLDLAAQRARLVGLRALDRGGLARLVLALDLRRQLDRILRQDPDHSLANYLLGRWHLVMPTALGGRTTKAVVHLNRSAENSAPGDTRALVGLAEAQVALGRHADAVASLRRVIAETPPAGRGESRINKAMEQLNGLLAGPVPGRQAEVATLAHSPFAHSAFPFPHSSEQLAS